MLRTALLALAIGPFLTGCAATGASAGSTASAPMPGRVTDMKAFGLFIESLPTVEQFRARYPDVVLVQPGEMATKEYRTDNSRYFAEFDIEGRIVGGSFK
jgi:hypothetical protein